MNFSLAVITLTVRVIYQTVFEYQNQVIFNMTVFSMQTKTSFLEYEKQVIFQYDAF